MIEAAKEALSRWPTPHYDDYGPDMEPEQAMRHLKLRETFAEGAEWGAEEAFKAAWFASSTDYNGEYPDEGKPWHETVGYERYLEWRGTQ